MYGIVPSLNTPFDASGELDLSSLSRLVEHTVSTGCGGMLGLAVAGEHNTLNYTEKSNFIYTVVKKIRAVFHLFVALRALLLLKP